MAVTMSQPTPASDAEFRSGLVSIVGRPNTGKSTLMNALAGEKIAITSSRPQTTRHVVRGVVHRPGSQIVFVDTPGLHKPRTLLGQRLNDEVRNSLTDVDVIAITLPANEAVGPGDRLLASEAAKVKRAPKVAVVTKAELVKPDQMAVHLMQVSNLAQQAGFEWAEVVPVSAVTGLQLDVLVDVLVPLLPQGEAFFPQGQSTDEPEIVRIGELIREASLEGVRDELPHSIAVLVDEVAPREDRPKERPLTDVRATLFVERTSQKAIVIGRGGQRLREVGEQARHEIEALLGTPVYLDLCIKVAKDWQRDPKQLRRVGF